LSVQFAVVDTESAIIFSIINPFNVTVVLNFDDFLLSVDYLNATKSSAHRLRP